MIVPIVTSLSRELGSEQSVDAFADTIAARFGAGFERAAVAIEPGQLGLDLPPATLGVPR